MRIFIGAFLAKVVERICFCKQKTYFYRSTPGSITNKINIEKEAFAFHTIIEDFCLHIDAFERNAQKRLVFVSCWEQLIPDIINLKMTAGI